MTMNSPNQNQSNLEDAACDIVRIGSNVTIKLSFSGETEVFSVKFVEGTTQGSGDFISKNSPLGKIILNKSTGFIGSYTVDKENFTAEILEVHPA